MFKFTPKFKEAIEKNPNFTFITFIGASDVEDMSFDYESAYEAAEFESNANNCDISEGLEVISEFTAEEVMEAAQKNMAWPILAGYVEEFDDMEEEESIMLAPEYAMNEKFIIHHGEYDTNYSEFSSVEEAWESEVCDEAWVGEVCASACIGLTDVKEIWVKSCSTYTASEVIEAAKSGYGWPFDLGLVVEA